MKGCGLQVAPTKPYFNNFDFSNFWQGVAFFEKPLMAEV
jgi:hypothetical protein